MKNLEKVEKKIKVFSYCFTFETPYWEEDLLRISREEHIFEARNEREAMEVIQKIIDSDTGVSIYKRHFSEGPPEPVKNKPVRLFKIIKKW